MSDYYLKPGLAQPKATDIDAPYWSGLREGVLRVQQCPDCQGYQWGPEWICHHCHSDGVTFVEVEPSGTIYSYERVWHPVHPALAEQGPYLVVLVELPQAGNIRMIGNLLGNAEQEVVVGAQVRGVYEHHEDAEAPYTLLQWEVV
ncbi:MAG: OB-fold domain-containing protein [Pseudomonadota bacterium]|nr:OB-fold domain-containing protein [Pseudomonadota bacterium]